MPTRNVSLTEHLDEFVEACVQSGQYQNASEVVRDALRLFEERRRRDAIKLERMKAEVKIGQDALSEGRSIRIKHDELGQFLSRLREEAKERLEHAKA
jgi:antitoxin ParD1/3/4